MIDLTSKQQTALDAITEFSAKKCRVPTGAELGKILGKHRSQCGRLIETLEHKGYLSYGPWGTKLYVV